MYLLASILAVIVSAILIFFVVIQNSKGGGLAAGFSSSNQVMGVRKTTDFLEKATWTLAGVLVVLSIGASLLMQHPSATNDSSIKDEIQNTAPAGPNAVPDFGTAVPQGQQGQGNAAGGAQQTPAPAATPQQQSATSPSTAPTTPPQPAK